jgi:hypothetical protein
MLQGTGAPPALHSRPRPQGAAAKPVTYDPARAVRRPHGACATKVELSHEFYISGDRDPRSRLTYRMPHRLRQRLPSLDIIHLSDSEMR